VINKFIVVFLLFFSNITFAAYLPPAQGKKVMVVSAQHQATEVGLAILKQGGNAVDAAVAIGYALAVVHPCCGNLGGGGFMLLHRTNGHNIFINFREKAPSAISSKDFQNSDGAINKNKAYTGYLPVGVPGTVLGLNTALKRYGTMSLKKVMQPAIRLAKNGFVLLPGDIKILNKGTKYFRKQPNVAAIFLNKGKPYQAGERLKQPQLAKTLSAISDKGSKVFYDGWIAKAIVQASKAHGGVLQLRDFKNYHIEILKPIHCQYRGIEVVTSPPPSSGVTLCEMLNILNGYPLRKFGYHSATNTAYNIEAMRYAFADRNRYLGDPNFVHNPVKRLLSAEYTASIRQLINPNKAGNSNNLKLPIIDVKQRGNTTHFNVVDQYGNAVSLTTTLNSFFGSKVIAHGTGFLLNNELDDFTLKIDTANKFQLKQGEANLIQANKRPLSSMTPTILFKNGKVFMLLGAAGGPTIITTILETIEHVMDSHMNINAALNSPRYHMQWQPDITYMEPFCFSKDTLNILKQHGYHFHQGFLKEQYWGQGAAILISSRTGILYGANDNRYPAGLAKGY